MHIYTLELFLYFCNMFSYIKKLSYRLKEMQNVLSKCTFFPLFRMPERVTPVKLWFKLNTKNISTVGLSTQKRNQMSPELCGTVYLLFHREITVIKVNPVIENALTSLQNFYIIFRSIKILFLNCTHH